MNAARKPRARAAVRLALVVAGALVGLVLTAGPANAHATLVSTDPAEGAVLAAAPEQARLTFDEPVRVQSGAVHVFDARGTELKASSHTADSALLVDLPDEMPDGTYVVSWRVISADGHPVAGALTFSVGSPSPAVARTTADPADSGPGVRVALGVLQGVAYAGTFAATGLVVFLLLLLPAGSGLDEVRRRISGTARLAAVVAFIAWAMLLPVTQLNQRGLGFGGLGEGDVWTSAVTQLEATSALITSLGVAAAVILVAGADSPRRRTLSLVAACAALASLALVGHTRAVGPAALVMTADLAHVAAGSTWVGGLLGLVLTLSQVSGRPRLAATVLVRFSLLAAWLLGLVALTGSILGWRILRSWSALVDTDFGRVLLAKVAVVALVVIAAAWNRFRLLPAVSADGGFETQRRSVDRLRNAVAAEAVLLAAVLGITGFLVDRTPVEASAPIAVPGGLDPTTFVGQGADVRVVASVQPGAVGTNTLLVQVQNPAGEPIEPYAVPDVSMTAGDVSLDVALAAVDSGTYQATVVVPRAGAWRLNASVRLTEFDNPVVSVVVPVR